MWGSGNYAAVAEKISQAGESVIERSGLEPGMDVLDVACGTGNATIPAARAGARVTGLDFSPELLEIARERGSDAMVEVEWVEGDAQELPFEDASFDRVISTFGHMFAPDHRRTADEMRRVCRPGGTIATACWTPEGAIGRMFRTTRRAGSAAARRHAPDPLGNRGAPARAARRGGLRAGRDRVAGRVGRVLRPVHAGELRPAAERAGGRWPSGRASWTNPSGRS